MVCLLSHFVQCPGNNNRGQSSGSFSADLTVFYQNVRGLRTKTSVIFNAILSESYPVIVLTETWLNDSFSSSEVVDSRYVVYRKDRNIRTSSKERGGGVLVAVHRSLFSCEIPMIDSNIEELWVKIQTVGGVLLLCAVYIPPSSDASIYVKHLESVECVVDNYDTGKICIIGDYNLPNIKWIQNPAKDGVTAVNCNGETESYFCDSLNYLNLCQLNFIYNCNNVLLDLVLCDSDSVDVDRAYPLVSLDNNHPSLLITLNELDFRPLDRRVHYKYLFDKAPYDLINSALAHIDWNIVDLDDIDLSVTQFYRMLFEVIDNYVPRKRVVDSSFPNWVSAGTRALICSKREAHKKFKTSQSHSDYQIFSALRQDVKVNLERDKSDYIEYTENAVINNPRHFWKYVSSLRKDTTIPNLMTYNVSSCVGGYEISNCFAEYFESNYQDASAGSLVNNLAQNLSTQISLNCVDILCEMNISDHSILDAILSIGPKSSCGPDKIPTYFTFHCAQNLAEPLHIIFKKCLIKGLFPSAWKCSNVIPIYKSGPRSDITNYRPISLNNSFAKVFDFMMSKVIAAHVSGYIISQQHGFSIGKSTETNLFVFTNFIYKSIESGSTVDCIFTDIRKAFDRVPINLLLFKLKNLYGIRGALLSCLEAYLLGRSQHVTVNGYVSDTFTVASGVGQGTHLGPVLFSLYINDIKYALECSDFLLFADDCKMFKRISSHTDQAELQRDLNNFYGWCDVNSLSVNVEKCKYMQFTRQTNPLHFRYTLDGIPLETVSSIKDLGIYLDNKLSFNLHVDSIIARANKTLGFIIRSTKPFNNVRALMILYVAIVRSVMEYCCIVWAPSYITRIRRLEKVQRKFVKFLCFKSHIIFDSFPYEHHLQHFSLPHLLSRRTFYDVMFAFKVLNDMVKCPDISSLFVTHAPSRPLRHHRLLEVEFHRTNYGLHSPLVRICNGVNNIAADLSSDLFADERLTFKHKLRSLLF